MEEKKHNITLEDKKRLYITLCSEVLSFNEDEVKLIASGNTLIVKGRGLCVEEVSKTTGDVVIIGEDIESIVYSKPQKRNKEGVIRRMLK